MISEHISDHIPPQIKILNMVIPIIMLLYSLVSNWSIASCIKPHIGVCHQMKCDVINDVKLFPTVYCIFLRYPIRRRITKASALELMHYSLSTIF